MRRPRTGTLLAAAAWIAALGLAAISLVLLALGSSAFGPQDPPPAGLEVAVYLVCLATPTVGAFVSLRRPGNAIGPVLLVAGLSFFAWRSSLAYAAHALITRPDLPGGVIAAWVATWVFYPNVLLLLVFLPLLFPDGRFLSRRWRVIGRLAAVLVACQVVVAALGRTDLVAGVPNPLGVAALVPVNSVLNGLLGAPLAFALLAISGAAVVTRFGRARGIERLQVKWFCYAVVDALIVLGTAFALLIVGVLPDNIASPATFLAFALLPVAVGIAILRYRLYDIDLVIRRTVVYGVTTGAIGLTFFGGVVVLPALLRPLISGSEVAIAVSTLVAFALFQPLRARVQRAVDRRFYRSRYDAARTLDAFSVRLRDEVDLDSVRGELLDAVRDTVQPASAGVWLR